MITLLPATESPAVDAPLAPAPAPPPPLLPGHQPVWERLSPELLALVDVRSAPPVVQGDREVAKGEPQLAADSLGSKRVEPAEFSSGQPLADPFCVIVPDRQEVREIIVEFTGPQRATFTEALRRSGRYLPLIRSVLSEEALPQELAYLSLVESHFVPDARSVSGALGLWQFMDMTAREYGLRVDGWVDERLDPEAATRAAVRHLGDLFVRFGDWNLAVAAYNAGSGGVGRAVDRHGAESFWDLFLAGGLRDQTCRYVVKFLAAVSIASEPDIFGLEIGALDPPLSYETVWADYPVALKTVARLASTSETEIRGLNPALLRGVTPPGVSSYPVRVPAGEGKNVATQLRQLSAAERLAFLPHRVRRGETLAGIARKYGTTRDELAALNNVPVRRRLRPNDQLWVLVAQGKSAVSTKLRSAKRLPDATPSRTVHVVRSGETLWGISRHYGVSPTDLMRWNRRAAGSDLRPGDKLLISAEMVERGG